MTSSGDNEIMRPQGALFIDVTISFYCLHFHLCSKSQKLVFGPELIITIPNDVEKPIGCLWKVPGYCCLLG